MHQPPDRLVRRPRLSDSPLLSLLTRRRFCLSLLLVFLAATPEWAAPQASSFESGSGVVSPAVVATSIVQKNPDGTSQLVLLVLWRGNPGWFIDADSEGSSSHSSIGTSGDGKGGEVDADVPGDPGQDGRDGRGISLLVHRPDEPRVHRP